MLVSNPDYKGEYDDPFVFCSDGSRFYLNAPTFDIEVIAHALCNNVRFNGHIKYPWSVGQHSMLVMDIVDTLAEARDTDLLEALLHDATEAYMSDIPAPFKRLLPDWKCYDAKLDAALRCHFQLPEEKSPVVAKADWLALFIEAQLLLPSGCAQHFEDPFGYRDEAFHLANFYELWDEIRPAKLERDKQHFLACYRAACEALLP